MPPPVDLPALIAEGSLEPPFIDVSVMALHRLEPDRKRVLLTRRPATAHLGGA
jgi:hypothetical protein